MIISVGIPVLLFYTIAKPYEQGFFCGDESLSYPYKKDTVAVPLLVSVGLSLPIVMVRNERI